MVHKGGRLSWRLLFLFLSDIERRNMDSIKTDLATGIGYKVTDKDEMLLLLRGLYCSFEKAQAILQFVTEHSSYTDKYIHIFTSSNFAETFYYKMKAIPEWY